MIQSFGPEARGSACSATLVVSKDEVLYPYIQRPDIFVVMSTEGYEKFGEELREDGVLVYEKDLVQPVLKGSTDGFRGSVDPYRRISGKSHRPEHRHGGVLCRGLGIW